MAEEDAESNHSFVYEGVDPSTMPAGAANARAKLEAQRKHELEKQRSRIESLASRLGQQEGEVDYERGGA